MGEIGDCNSCGDENVPVRFIKLDDDEDDEVWKWGAYYCEGCWDKFIKPILEKQDA